MARWTGLSASELAAKGKQNRASWKEGAIVTGLETAAVAPKKQAKTRSRDAQIVAGKLSESQVLRGCMEVLESHPCVFLWWRQNTGAVNVDGKRFVRFSFKGASDLMGVLQGGLGGRFLAVECKATGKKASREQQGFLDNVLEAGGWAVCVDHPQKLTEYLRALL